MTLSDAHSETLTLSVSPTVTGDVGVSEGVARENPSKAEAGLYLLAQTLPRVWQTLVARLPENPWLAFTGETPLVLSVIVVSNPEIHALNRAYRHKDEPTDVVTFSLHEAAVSPPADTMPEYALGEVYLSLDWAEAATQTSFPTQEGLEKSNFRDTVSLYLLERLVHGCLHLLGVHHDTPADYNKVVMLQQQVLDVLCSNTSRNA